MIITPEPGKKIFMGYIIINGLLLDFESEEGNLFCSNDSDYNKSLFIFKFMLKLDLIFMFSLALVLYLSIVRNSEKMIFYLHVPFCQKINNEKFHDN